MKRVAVIGLRGFPQVQGGVEVHCQHIYPLMDDVALTIYRRKPYLNDASRAASYPHIQFVDLPSTRIQGFEAAFHTFIAALHALWHRPDVVHVHNLGPALFALPVKLAGIPVVMTYHSTNYTHDKWGPMAKRFLRWCERMSLRYCDRIIFVNRFQMETYDERVRRKSVYIPNGIDPVTRSSSTSFLDAHGITAGAYLLAVGRITREKGFESLIEAANRCPAVQQVVIAGSSDHDPSYIERLQRLDTGNKVIFTGFTAGEDLRQLYSHARLQVLPSLAEGFPLVLLEGMSYGLPVAVSDLPATHLVTLPQQAYFEAGNVDSMVQCLERLLASNEPWVPYQLDDFNWEAIAASTRAQYDLARKNQ